MQAKDLMHLPSDDSGVNKSLAEDKYLHKDKLGESQLDWDSYDDVHGLADAPDPGSESLYESIAKRGVQKPVSIRLYADQSEGKYIPRLTNGNHRTATAHDIDPEMWIPVTYTDRMYGNS